VVYQGSKLSLINLYAGTALWELCGHPAPEWPDVNTDADEVMDRLLERQPSIETSLASQRLEDGCLIYYDMTSSRFSTRMAMAKAAVGSGP